MVVQPFIMFHFRRSRRGTEATSLRPTGCLFFSYRIPPNTRITEYANGVYCENHNSHYTIMCMTQYLNKKSCSGVRGIFDAGWRETLDSNLFVTKFHYVRFIVKMILLNDLLNRYTGIAFHVYRCLLFNERFFTQIKKFIRCNGTGWIWILNKLNNRNTSLSVRFRYKIFTCSTRMGNFSGVMSLEQCTSAYSVLYVSVKQWHFYRSPLE